jgi:hypothetical protein
MGKRICTNHERCPECLHYIRTTPAPAAAPFVAKLCAGTVLFIVAVVLFEVFA